ncbi:MAG: hypothetical protein RR053_07670 [Evtepia sp.]
MFIVLSKRFFGFIVIFGKPEQARFETQRGEFASNGVDMYNTAKAYYDGKWFFLTYKRLFLPAS